MEVTRGSIVESIHFGAIAVVDASGRLVAHAGSPDLVTYLRSTCKPIQALPLIESGAADAFGFGERQLAIACGSHSGSDLHASTVRDILRRAGLDESALGCGTHVPGDKAARKQLRASGSAPAWRVLLNLGRRPEGYDSWRYERPTQAEARAGEGTFNGATDVAWDSNDNIYISDGYVNSRIVCVCGNIIETRSTRGDGSTGGAALRILKVNLTSPLIVTRMPALVAPGAKAKIQVRLDTSGLRGRFPGEIQVLLNDPDLPQANLSFEGEIVPPLEFLPAPAFFLGARRGESRTASIDLINHEPRGSTRGALVNPRHTRGRRRRPSDRRARFRTRHRLCGWPAVREDAAATAGEGAVDGQEGTSCGTFGVKPGA